MNDTYRNYPTPPTESQRAEHEALMEQKRQRRADELGITVDELDRRIEAGEPLDER